MDGPAPKPPRAGIADPTTDSSAEGSGAGPKISGWGRVYATGREVFSENLESLSKGAVLSRGLGRSYGDSALPPPGTVDVATTTLANRILSFDEKTGIIRAEAGTSLFDLNWTFLRRPEPWFTPVSPGTQFVTLGGMVASDIHGKNHHVAGTFGQHVTLLRMRVADGRIVECSPELESELFWATVGGMGLTGHILEVEFRMKKIPSPWIYQETMRVPNIDAFMEKLDETSAAGWPMSMGWIDCMTRGSGMGRGVLFRGRWAASDEEGLPASAPKPRRRITVPFTMPNWLLNPVTTRMFNFGIYNSHVPQMKKGIVHPEDFFYPLDKIREWNRIYGSRGMAQYQCVLPESAGKGAARRMLELLTTQAGAGSFLCVIKDCGPRGQGMLSFPTKGFSIALDIPVGDRVQETHDILNRAVIAEGGRMYLTKDGYTRPEHFRAMYPRLDEFLAVRRKWDPEGRLKSAQSVRILGDE